ncbi:MAG TPA: GNAT family N-acetyltransferase [Pirellulales bacterium]|nr:GNAT family N-acetyltransferase [Pirellulales bacterium]
MNSIDSGSLDPLVELLIEAFWDDPWFSSLAADGTRRRKILQTLFGALVRYAHRHHAIAATTSGDAVACWLPRDVPTFTTWGLLRAGIWRLPLLLGRDRMHRFMAHVEHVEALRKRLQPTPHMYLALLAVAPRSQGTGVGGQLLESVLKQLDESATPFYLETHNPRNVPFYERHGFALLGQWPSPVDGISTWAMRRPP